MGGQAGRSAGKERELGWERGFGALCEGNRCWRAALGAKCHLGSATLLATWRGSPVGFGSPRDSVSRGRGALTPPCWAWDGTGAGGSPGGLVAAGTLALESSTVPKKSAMCQKIPESWNPLGWKSPARPSPTTPQHQPCPLVPHPHVSVENALGFVWLRLQLVFHSVGVLQLLGECWGTIVKFRVSLGTVADLQHLPGLPCFGIF